MKSETLLKNVPRYRYIKATDNSQESAENVFNVFYIGEDPSVLQHLADGQQTGITAVVSFPQAIAYLAQLQQEDLAFSAIFIDLPFQLQHMMNVQKFIMNSKFAQVPVIYMSSHLTEKDKEEIRRQRLADDIIHPIRDLFTARERISFISRIKSTLHKGKSGVVVETRFPTYRSLGGVMKRMVDIVAASLILLLISPLMLLIAILIKMDSSGPVFYNAYRAGRGYRIFKFFKFRTMKVGADRMVSSLTHMNQYGAGHSQVFFKLNNDPRVTRIGAFLRNTSLDELPQLFNVLKGDMSLVGNRPLPLYEASSLTTNQWAERFVAPAGITGLWQVKKRGKADMSVEERIGLDIDYAKKYNLVMDFWIMMQTPRVLLQENNV